MARHRKLRGRRLKKQRQIIIISLICLTFLIGTGYAAFSTNITLTAKGNIKQDENCVVNKVWEFDYENYKVYDLTIPCSGKYKLETWGAQGGNALTLEGGYGGYSVGNIYLKRKNTLYIVVGGSGEASPDIILQSNNYVYHTNGGYNGGGNGTSGRCGSLRYGSGGGGATSIALQNGLLTEFENNINNLLIVAGGGGGAFAITDSNGNYYNVYGTGANSGGYIGNAATFTLIGHTKTHYTQGGTQDSGGIAGNSYDDNIYNALKGDFGKGGSDNGGACGGSGAGGAGYYGGGAGAFAPGGGGSSYINNDNLKDKHMTCYNCTPTTDTDPEGIKTISTNKVDKKPLEDTAKKGNGYAKITLISRN